MKVVVKPLSLETWRDLEKVFGPRGACFGCWCMYWRRSLKARKLLAEKCRKPSGRVDTDEWNEASREELKRLVRQGKAHGLILYADEEPVGWVTVGPREHFPRIDETQAYKNVPKNPDAWSIPCFFIKSKWRGKGFAPKLLHAALEFIRSKGGKVAEGYPVTTTKTGKRVSPMGAWTGPEVIFRRTKFKRVVGSSPYRPVVRLELGK